MLLRSTSLILGVALTACTGGRSTLTVTHGALVEHRTDPVPTSAAAPGSVLIVPPEVPGGRIRFSVHDVANEADLPSRVVIRGVEGTRDPVLGPSNEAAGAYNLVVVASGRGEIALPPGHYSLTFSHGLEWTIAQMRADITTERGADVTARLERVIPMRDWTACDLHVHASPSFDSRVSIPDRVASLVAEGIEFAAPTEHNVIGNYAEGVSALPASATRAHGGPGLSWVPAVEVTTDSAPEPTGHFNVYPYRASPEAPNVPPPFVVTPAEIFRAVRAGSADSIIQVNHPRMQPDIGYFDRVNLDTRTNRAVSPLYDPGYDAIEVFNGFFLGAPAEVDRVLLDWLALLNSGARYVGTASSDSHHVGYEQAGYPRTFVYTPGAGNTAPEDTGSLIRSLRAGHAFGTSGPMLMVSVGNAIPGDTVHIAAAEIPLHIRVMAAPWIDVNQLEVYRDGARVVVLSIPESTSPTRFDDTLTLPAPSTRSFFVVVARGSRPLEAVLPHLNARPFAFTNPIWIER